MFRRRCFGVAFVAVMAAAVATAADPPTWGFIDVNVTCKTPQGKSFRVKLVSKIFSYCGLDINPDQIVQGNNVEIDQAADSACDGGTHQITYSFVDRGPDKNNVEKDYDREMSNPEYQKHEKFACSCVYYMSSKCHSKEQ